MNKTEERKKFEEKLTIPSHRYYYENENDEIPSGKYDTVTINPKLTAHEVFDYMWSRIKEAEVNLFKRIKSKAYLIALLEDHKNVKSKEDFEIKDVFTGIILVDIEKLINSNNPND
jgi:hypothetical protein